MNLEQVKLTKSEWDSIEIPSPDNEKKVFKLIIKGFSDINYCENNTLSIYSYLKINDKDIIDDYIFINYIQPELIKIFKLYNAKYDPITLKTNKLKSADQIRLKNMEKVLEQKREYIYEFILINLLELILKNLKEKNKIWIKYLYTIIILKTYNIKNVNKYFYDIVDILISHYLSKIDKYYLIKNANEIMNTNKYIHKYRDIKLYDHQKELFVRMKQPRPKLVFYVAPTGTGKTLSPLGLSEKFKIIFICAVRHVGLALAKAAISINKCTAFAFGCADTNDIRLHYFSAKDYEVNRKTGGIFKVDNSVGDKVEIMISDIKSYQYAMNYMLAFNKKENIILYWDEPTISLDYETHYCHDIIKNNWAINQIPNIVLSSATLPPKQDLTNTIMSYKSKFYGEEYFIKSYDLNKSVSIINREGYVEAPHYISSNYKKILESFKYIEKNLTILKYIDFNECINFILYINKNRLYNSEQYALDNYFELIENITMHNIKLYYLYLLKNISAEMWEDIHEYFIDRREKRFASTTYISTKDAYTLINGPTIYITEDVNNIAYFCLQCMNIPKHILSNLSKVINYNTEILEKITALEKKYEDGINKEDMKDNKLANDRGISPEMRLLKRKINELTDNIKTVKLDDQYIPNSKDHKRIWTEQSSNTLNAYCSDISEHVVEKIMLIENIDDVWKLLLLMGIGVFSNQTNSAYLEIMKDLAKNKKLYLIIASSDFIYGTNYQFDHCYIGKDLNNMTQEKIIQAIGRVGRNTIGEEYTIRLRENSLISKIFTEEKNKIEIINMQKLFS